MVCLLGVGIALYVALSMTAKIPIVGHASLDLGYIVFAVYCYYDGSFAGAVVGGIGCMLVSLLTSGWFPPGWIAGNVLIGALVGYDSVQRKHDTIHRIGAVIGATFLGIFVTKTLIECALYSIPPAVKVPKSFIVWVMDAAVMSFGTWLAPKLPIKKI